MFLKIPILAHSNVFNKETTKYKAEYFKNEIELNQLLKKLSANRLNKISHDMYNIAMNNYKWERIISKYEQIFNM